MKRRAFACVLALGLVVVAAACAGGASDDDASSAARLVTVADQPRQRGPGCRFIVASDGRRRITAPEGRPVEYLVDAVAERTVCYDKITFTFDPGDGPDLPPGYFIEYRKEPFGLDEIGTSTASLDDADAVLYVALRPASTMDVREGSTQTNTYQGNLRLQLDNMHHTVIVEWISDYVQPTPENPSDDSVVWLIGLDRKRPFTVDSANQPPRVSVLVMR